MYVCFWVINQDIPSRYGHMILQAWSELWVFTSVGRTLEAFCTGNIMILPTALHVIMYTCYSSDDCNTRNACT